MEPSKRPGGKTKDERISFIIFPRFAATRETRMERWKKRKVEVGSTFFFVYFEV